MSAPFAVIMAGGSGTRFWPASRRLRPKQLLPLAPGSDEPLIAATVRRLRPLVPAERVLVATGEHLLDATRAALPELPASAFLGEPMARNTAPCIGWANAVIRRSEPDAIVLVVPSDQHVTDEAAYCATLERALESAAHGITTIGIEPTWPETGYGYIEAGDELTHGVRAVERFVEKPDRERAEGYLAAGNYYWNAGMFLFRAATMAGAIERHLPELHAGLARIDAAAGSQRETSEVRAVFDALESISIDYGVMEREPGLRVVPGSFGWSDLGSWQSAWELSERDERGNAADGGAVLIDASGTLVRDLSGTGGGKKTIAVVGVRDLCVVETDDALLIIPRERSQDVRRVIEQLKRDGRTDVL